MQPMPPCPAPPSSLVAEVCVWATSPLVVVVRHVFCGVFSSPGYVALWDSKTPHRHTCERVSYCLETSLSRLSPQDGFPSLTLLSLFLSFIFCPTSFQREWAAFLGAWCSLPASEVVLWKLLSIQVIFWWICLGESGLPVLFLHYLGTAPSAHFLIKIF